MNENVFAKYSLSLVFSLHSYLAFYNNIYHLDLGNITLGQLDYLFISVFHHSDMPFTLQLGLAKIERGKATLICQK